MVEHRLPKPRAAGSNPVFRSKKTTTTRVLIPVVFFNYLSLVFFVRRMILLIEDEAIQIRIIALTAWFYSFCRCEPARTRRKVIPCKRFQSPPPCGGELVTAFSTSADLEVSIPTPVRG